MRVHLGVRSFSLGQTEPGGFPNHTHIIIFYCIHLQQRQQTTKSSTNCKTVNMLHKLSSSTASTALFLSKKWCDDCQYYSYCCFSNNIQVTFSSNKKTVHVTPLPTYLLEFTLQNYNYNTYSFTTVTSCTYQKTTTLRRSQPVFFLLLPSHLSSSSLTSLILP